VDLSQTSILVEVIVRGGNARQHDARTIMQNAYQRPDELYPDVTGLSTLFHPHASLDDLAREGQMPNAQLSWSLLGELISELAAVGYGLQLYITPTPELRDHHTLAVLRNGVVEPSLSDDAADALLRALRVVDNPYRQPKPPRS